MTTPTQAITKSVDQACQIALGSVGWMDEHPRHIARWMLHLADALWMRRDELMSVASEETHLYLAELEPEMVRTVQNLRSFAVIASNRQPILAVGGVRSEHEGHATLQASFRRVMIPLGPVAVFGASNFPFAYGYLGTDASSALAAGCPVIVKSHPLQPRTYALQASIAHQASLACDVPAGVIQLLHGPASSTIELGTALVSHPVIQAVGFTGSMQGGLALDRIARERSVPIPFFGELGSVNPQLVLPEAIQEQGPSIATSLAQSLVARTGQQCTCPGVWILLHQELDDAPVIEAFYQAAGRVLAQTPPRQLLSAAIAKAYRQTCQIWLDTPGVQPIYSLNPAKLDDQGPGGDAPVTPCLVQASAATALAHPKLLDENFGPAAIIITCRTQGEVNDLLHRIGGALAASLWAGSRESLHPWASALARIAGRLVLQGVPTGVRVSPVMQHGGPFPASTRPETTAVGDQAIVRWQRPITLQGWQSL